MDATDRSDRAPSLTLPGPITTLLGNSRPLPATEADMTSIGRIHHITAIASAPDRNLAFYEGALGLRMIEETDAASDADAANILTAWSRQLDKNLWCLEAHLHGGVTAPVPGRRSARGPIQSILDWFRSVRAGIAIGAALGAGVLLWLGGTLADHGTAARFSSDWWLMRPGEASCACLRPDRGLSGMFQASGLFTRAVCDDDGRRRRPRLRSRWPECPPAALVESPRT
jgi:catechol 2,3-dioxygenase-like lactoylglutathione lyase family enzyme